MISWDNEIDLYDNWNDYVVGTKNRHLLNQFAKPKVRLAIVEQMLVRAKENATDEQGEKIVTELEYIRRGGFVPENWGWKTPNGDVYTGRISVTGQEDLLTI